MMSPVGHLHHVMNAYSTTPLVVMRDASDFEDSLDLPLSDQFHNHCGYHYQQDQDGRPVVFCNYCAGHKMKDVEDMLNCWMNTCECELEPAVKSLEQLRQILEEPLRVNNREEVASLLRDYLHNNSGDWNEYLLWDEKHYTRNLIFRNDLFEVVLICWNAGQQSPIHDSNGSECYMGVLQGTAEETHYHIDQRSFKEDPTECPDLRKGETHHYREGDISYISDDIALHRIRPVNGQAVSLHVFSPPLTSTGVYLQDLNRVSHPRTTYHSVNKQKAGLQL